MRGRVALTLWSSSLAKASLKVKLMSLLVLTGGNGGRGKVRKAAESLEVELKEDDGGVTTLFGS